MLLAIISTPKVVSVGLGDRGSGLGRLRGLGLRRKAVISR